jgi:alkanesulfonate monooxygenase SsuD/methylene tetrahydromethanopterin reductase-like flavin-dependent oxidoreductase (luciferase family)
MGPKAIARAAQWADGVYGASMGGDREGHEAIFAMASDAWTAAGRTEKPYLIGSFWYSLGPDAETALKSYVYDYMKYIGEDVGRGVAASMTRFTPDSVRDGIRNLQDSGADELLICPATAHYDEIDRLADIVAGI